MLSDYIHVAELYVRIVEALSHGWDACIDISASFSRSVPEYLCSTSHIISRARVSVMQSKVTSCKLEYRRCCKRELLLLQRD